MLFAMSCSIMRPWSVAEQLLAPCLYTFHPSELWAEINFFLYKSITQSQEFYYSNQKWPKTSGLFIELTFPSCPLLQVELWGLFSLLSSPDTPLQTCGYAFIWEYSLQIKSNYDTQGGPKFKNWNPQKEWHRDIETRKKAIWRQSQTLQGFKYIFHVFCYHNTIVDTGHFFGKVRSIWIRVVHAKSPNGISQAQGLARRPHT